MLTVFLSPCWGIFILLMIFQTHILGHCYCARSSHIRKVAFLSTSSPLEPRYFTYTRTQIVRSLLDVYSNICRMDLFSQCWVLCFLFYLLVFCNWYFFFSMKLMDPFCFLQTVTMLVSIVLCTYLQKVLHTTFCQRCSSKYF